MVQNNNSGYNNRKRFPRRHRGQRIPMKKLTRFSFLPSLFTLLNLLLSYLALMKVIRGDYIGGVFLVAISVVMDGFDGTIARLTRTESHFGTQLDSLVDAVSFGLTAAVTVKLWGFQSLNSDLGKVVSFLFLAAGVIRLARFNVLKEVDASPSNVFIGLPIPLAALAVLSPILVWGRPGQLDAQWSIWYAVYVVVISFLMISSIRYRTIKKIQSRHNVPLLFILAFILAVCILFPYQALPGITALYLLSPLAFWMFRPRNASRNTPGTPHDGEDRGAQGNKTRS